MKYGVFLWIMRFAKKAETKKDPMNVLSPEDANGSSIPSIQSVKKNRKEQVDVFRVYESSLKQLSERQTAKDWKDCLL